MAIETRRDKIIYHGVVPILGAAIGAVVATWFQSSSLDKAQIGDIVQMLKDPALSATQKLQALELYKDITDRPWAILRSLATILTVGVPMLGMALITRGVFDRRK